jgi:hypothetical protein
MGVQQMSAKEYEASMLFKVVFHFTKMFHAG